MTKPISDAQLVAAVSVRVDRARQLVKLIKNDSSTGLLKHTAIELEAAGQLVRANRLGENLAVIMLDIDHFKSVNDGYGHATGDLVISSVAMLLLS